MGSSFYVFLESVVVLILVQVIVFKEVIGYVNIVLVILIQVIDVNVQFIIVCLF